MYTWWITVIKKNEVMSFSGKRMQLEMVKPIQWEKYSLFFLTVSSTLNDLAHIPQCLRTLVTTCFKFWMQKTLRSRRSCLPLLHSVGRMWWILLHASTQSRSILLNILFTEWKKANVRTLGKRKVRGLWMCLLLALLERTWYMIS